MGTRSLTRVFDTWVEASKKPEQIVCVYRQMDGYPSGHGSELAEFLVGIKMVNGIGNDKARIANGAGCLAAQLVAHFKEGPGGIYLYPTKTKDAGQEYEYWVLASELTGIEVIVYEADGNKLQRIFAGSPEELAEFCKSKEAA